VAHHQDDHLETGLFQERRGGFIRHWGLEQETVIEGVMVLRPLWSWSKEDIRTYQTTHGVPYSEDASNASMDYTRNRLRHEIRGWNLSQRQTYLQTMETYNHQQTIVKQRLVPFTQPYQLPLSTYQAWTTHEQTYFWVLWFESRGFHFQVTPAFLSRMQGWIQSSKPNLSLTLTKEWTLYKAYDHLALIHELDLLPYVYQLRQPKIISHPFFTWKGGDYRMSPYPLLLRSVEKADYQTIQRLNRLFITWKVPLYLRRCYPLLVRPGSPFIHVPKYEKTKMEKRQDGLYFT